MKRIAAFLYGIFCYVSFLGTFLYAIGFLGNLGVPKSIDSGRQGSVIAAVAVDAALLLIFGLQHSVMARPGFKKVWTQLVHPAIERSTYLLFSNVALLFVFWGWQPIGGTVWNVEGGVGELVIGAFFVAGIVILLLTTFLLNHFDLFGLRQVYLYLMGRPYTQLSFSTPFLYQYVRHPLYIGWLLMFWAAPVMTSAHLVFALLTTAYIFVAIRYEETDLLAIHGETYKRYRARVPMIVPAFSEKTPAATRPSRLHTASGR